MRNKPKSGNWYRRMRRLDRERGEALNYWRPLSKMRHLPVPCFVQQPNPKSGRPG